MNYVSTRSATASGNFTDVLVQGLATDAGLYIPSHFPRISLDELRQWRGLSYPQLACRVAGKLIPSMAEEKLGQAMAQAYATGRFTSQEITPVSELERDLYLLHLSGGPTLAFKDVAMQLLGELFESVLSERGERLCILGATSGDTGPAAEHALRGKRRLDVVMLSPHGRMSAFQRAQMYSLADANIHNLAIDGSFDDCQDIVKALSSDLEFRDRHRLGAVNSINLGRVIAQVVYYVYGYLRVAAEPGAPVDYVVPTGNFGNVYAGHIAREMGVPIGRLNVATNENDTLHRLFTEGIYAPYSAGPTRETSSPSMDVSRPSNLERFLFELVDRDYATARALRAELAKEGSMDLRKRGLLPRMRDRFGFASGRSLHEQRIGTMRLAMQRWGRVIDPHTADGIGVGLQLRRPGVPLLALETALPVKFEAVVREALGFVPPRQPQHADLESRPQSYVVLPASAAAVRRHIEEMAPAALATA